MNRVFARIRVDADQIDLWTEILRDARNKRIEQKIRLREANPDDPVLDAMRWEIAEINRMIEEIRRAESEIYA